MRATLYHNPRAGSGDLYSSDDLVRLLREVGHNVVIVRPKSETIDARAADVDVVVVAGGDGTVAEAAIALAQLGATTPLFVLPTGTANNVARALSARDTVPVLVQRLGRARAESFDVCAAAGPSRVEWFVESAGVGFFGAVLRRTHSLIDRLRRSIHTRLRGPLSGHAQVQAAANGVARWIRTFRARHYEVSADGADLSGAYLGIESMNIATLGPRLPLAPGARTDDGLLDLVLIRAEDREAAARSFESMHPGDVTWGERHRARAIEIAWTDRDAHVDDTWLPPSTFGPAPSVRISVRSTIQVLRPVAD